MEASNTLSNKIKPGKENAFRVDVSRNEANFDRACDAAYTIATIKVDMDDSGWMRRVEGNQASDEIVVTFVSYTRIGCHHGYEFSCWVAREERDEDDE